MSTTVLVQEKEQQKQRVKRDKIYTIGPDGKLDLHFHPGQTRAWLSKKRIIFIFAGTQSGKTSFGPWWLWREIYGDGKWPGRGAGDYFVATTSYDLFNLKLLPAMREVFEDVLKLGRYWARDRIIELRPPDGNFWAKKPSDRMWGRIILRSASSKEGLESATIKAAWLDEVGQYGFDREAWEAINRRVALERGRILGTTTVYNFGWTKTLIYDRWLEGDPDIDVIQFPSYLNPAFPREEYERAKRIMPRWRFEMFYEGKFSRPEGLVFQSVLDRMFVPEDETPDVRVSLIGVDFGGANTAIVAAGEKDGTWYVVEETMRGGVSSEEHVQWVLQRWGKVIAVGGAPAETQFRMDWRQAGLPVYAPPVVEVEAGIDRIIRLVNMGKLRISKKCEELVNQLYTYHRVLDEQGRPTDRIYKQNEYHLVDALRYLSTWIAERSTKRRGVFVT